MNEDMLDAMRIELRTCLGTPVKKERFRFPIGGGRTVEQMNLNGRIYGPIKLIPAIKFKHDSKMGLFHTDFNMATDYNHKEKAMAKRKFFKFKFITLEREDAVTVDGYSFPKSMNGLEGFGFSENGTYYCTIKETIDECDIRFIKTSFGTEYFFKEKSDVTMIPVEFVYNLKG